MTAHEKLDAKTRVARHRAAMRAKGYRLKQMWVRDTRDPEYLEQVRAACEAINASPSRDDDLRFAAELQYWPPEDPE